MDMVIYQLTGSTHIVLGPNLIAMYKCQLCFFNSSFIIFHVKISYFLTFCCSGYYLYPALVAKYVSLFSNNRVSSIVDPAECRKILCFQLIHVSPVPVCMVAPVLPTPQITPTAALVHLDGSDPSALQVSQYSETCL